MKNLETEISETIFLKLNISNKKWVIGIAYKDLQSPQIKLYFLKN